MEKKTKVIKETFNEIINDFINIIDYDELDLLKFLNIKREGKYYNLLTKKILLYIFYSIIIMSQVFLVNILEQPILTIVSIIVSLIAVTFLNFAVRIEKVSQKKFKFTIGFYKKERKDLLDYQVQIQLLFHNHFLLKLLESDSFKSKVNKKITQMNKIIENYKNAFKPITYKIKQYGLIGISISLIFSFFTNFLIQYYLNPKIIEPLLVFGLLLPATNLFLFGIVYYLLKKRKNKILYNYRTWLQISKSLLSSKIKDLILLLHSIEFNNLEKGANDKLKELKSKLGKDIEKLEKKLEETKQRIKEIKETVKVLKKEKIDEELKSNELEKRKLKEDLKNIREERKLKKKKLKT